MCLLRARMLDNLGTLSVSVVLMSTFEHDVLTKVPGEDKDSSFAFEEVAKGFLATGTVKNLDLQRFSQFISRRNYTSSIFFRLRCIYCSHLRRLM